MKQALSGSWGKPLRDRRFRLRFSFQSKTPCTRRGAADTFWWKMAPRAPKGRFILLFERFWKGSKKGQFFDAHSEAPKIEPNRALEPQGPSPPSKKWKYDFRRIQGSKNQSPQAGSQLSKKYKQKTIKIEKKILTRLWAVGPANF